jgi:hypothetical protein
MMFFFCILVLNSCDESLPPHVQPAILFRGVLRPQTVPTHGYSALYVWMTVTNIFDETLQAPAAVQGNMVITLERDPSIHKTVTVDKTLLLITDDLRPQGQVTLNPGDSLAFVFKWTDFIDDNGNSLLTTVFHDLPDPFDPTKRIPVPETFIVRGSLQVFSTFGSVSFQPVELVFQYYFPQ